ncbi:MAG: helix-turn-helix transcriptional regulator [Chloroflexota bacterium]
MAERPDILVEFGRRVRELRQELGLSQEDLAFRTELDRSYISGIERGRRNVALRNILVLASSLDVTLAQMFEGLEQQ